MKRGDAEQEHRVDDGGEDLEPQVAEGAADARGTGGEPDRQQGEADPADVGEHVPRVGQEGKAVRECRGDELDEEDASVRAKTAASRPRFADAAVPCACGITGCRHSRWESLRPCMWAS